MLLISIGSSHAQLKKSDSKKWRKLKRLAWSLNYEGSASRESYKEKGIVHSL